MASQKPIAIAAPRDGETPPETAEFGTRANAPEPDFVKPRAPEVVDRYNKIRTRLKQ